MAFGVALAAIVTSGARRAAASPEDLFGFGAHAMAMGGTGAAAGEGYETVHANPALLSTARSRELTLGFQAATFSLHADGPRAPGRIDAPSMKGTIIGGVLPLPFAGVLENRIALGFGFFTPTDVVVRGRILYPEKPQFALLADRAQSVAVQAGFGADLGFGVRVGAGFAALAAIAGEVTVATSVSGQIGTVVEDQLVASYAPVFGAAVDLGEGFRAGATYRGVLEGRFAVTIYVHDLGSLVVPPFNIAGVAQYDPAEVQAEIARTWGPNTVALGATFKRWSRYPGAPEPTVLCDANPDCGALVPPAPGFHDTIVPRLGGERRFALSQSIEGRARLGAFYEPTPAPEQTGTPNGFDESRVALTGGFGLRLDVPALDVDVVGQWHELIGRTHVKDAGVAPDAAGAPETKTGGRVVVGGVTVGVRF